MAKRWVIDVIQIAVHQLSPAHQLNSEEASIALQQSRLRLRPEQANLSKTTGVQILICRLKQIPSRTVSSTSFRVSQLAQKAPVFRSRKRISVNGQLLLPLPHGPLSSARRVAIRTVT